MESEESIYVGIENPIELRRALLESTKGMIRILQADKTLREKRREKLQLIGEYKNTIKEITDQITQLKSHLPKIKMGALPKKIKPANPKAGAPAEIAKPFNKIQPPAPISETAKLANELKDIEAKLGKL